MANLRAANVLIVDTNASTVTYTLHIHTVKLVGTSGAVTFTISKGSNVVYEAKIADASTTTVYEHGIPLYLPTGATFAISGTGAKAYLYLNDETC